MNHQPKGGMCAVCANKHKDCSGLKFDEMPIYCSYKVGMVKSNIVICTEFKREKELET